MRIFIALLLVTVATCADQRAPPVEPPVLSNNSRNESAPRVTSGYFHINGREYYIYIDRLVTWLESVAVCDSLGMSLMSLETQVEDEAVRNYILDNGYWLWWFWTSALYAKNDDNGPKQGLWLWSGSGQAFSYEGWYFGYPIYEVYDCVAAYTSYLGWADTTCNYQLYAVCEQRN